MPFFSERVMRVLCRLGISFFSMMCEREPGIMSNTFGVILVRARDWGSKSHGHQGFDGRCGGTDFLFHQLESGFQPLRETAAFAGMKYATARCGGRHDQAVGTQEPVDKILKANGGIPHQAVFELNADLGDILASPPLPVTRPLSTFRENRRNS